MSKYTDECEPFVPRIRYFNKNKTDIESLKAKEHTLYQAIADLTARIETLENSASS